MANKIIIYGGIALALVLSLLSVSGRNTVVTQPVGSTVSLEQVDNGYYSIGGIKAFNFSQPIAATTTDFCFSKNPFNATSTVVNLSTIFSSSTPFTTVGGGASLSIAYSISTTTATAGNTTSGSSTPAIVWNHGIAGGAGQDSMFWTPGAGTTTQIAVNTVLTTASTTGETFLLIPPGTSLVWRYSTTTTQSTYTGYTYYPQGTCHATWQQL